MNTRHYILFLKAFNRNVLKRELVQYEFETIVLQLILINSCLFKYCIQCTLG